MLEETDKAKLLELERVRVEKKVVNGQLRSFK